MAEKTICVSDLSGKEGAEPFPFGVDGVEYTIDLTPEEAENARATFAGLVAKGKRVGGRRSPASRGGALPSRPSLIRKWAVDSGWADANGVTVSNKGRVPAEMEAAYAAAHVGGGGA